MAEKKTFIRFFTIADYEEEELWLHTQHKKGWKLVKLILPCFFVFERCAPEDVTYRLDFKNAKESGDYFQMFQDYGWEYIGQLAGWLYFRKPAVQGDSEADRSLFSDNASKLDLIDHILKNRMLPVLIVFLCCVLPNFVQSIENRELHSILFTIFFSILTLLYGWAFLYCGLKLRKLRAKYSNETAD